LVLVETVVVLTIKVALVLPAATVTLEGTVATDVLVLVRLTTAPPDGAFALRVTVPVELLPPVRLVGFRASEERVTTTADVTVKVADAFAPPYVPEIVTLVFVETLVVLTVKVALVLPAATVTLEGTVATDVFPLERVTTAPPDGASPLRVTVPVELLPPVTLVGFRVSEPRAAGVTVKVADSVAPAYVPEIVTLVLVKTVVVITVKAALVLPAATVTLLGTLATALLLESDTTAPPEGAGAVRLTVPNEAFPPVVLVGFRVSEEIVTGPPGVTVKSASLVVPLYVPEIVMLKVVDTLVVLTAKVALVLPAATVTLAGTVATEEFPLERATTAPPEGAAALRVTVPVELAPPLTLVGFRVSEEMLQELLAFTVKLLEMLAPPDSAKVGTTTFVVVHRVPSEKLRLVWPAGTVTVTVSTGGLGTPPIACEGSTKTWLPPEGAAAVRVTVAVVLVPPVTLLGLKLIDLTATPGVSVRVACTVLFPRAAVIVTAWSLLTNPLVVTAKVVLVAPAGTVTLPGTMMKVLLEDSCTTEPPDGASPLKVTVPVDVPPFGMVVGFNVTEERVGPHPAVLSVSSKTVP